MPPNKQRILIFTQNDWFFNLHFRPLGRALANSYEDVVLMCNVNEHRASIEELGLRVRTLNSFQVRSLGLLNQINSIAELIRIMHREKPDIVLLISPKPIVLGSLAALLVGTPFVLSLMTGLGFLFMVNRPFIRMLRQLVKLELRWTHRGSGYRMLFQNTTDRNTMLEAGIIDPDKAHLVGGVGTDLDRFIPSERNNDPPVIVFGGRMLRDKGVVELVEAARLLRKREIPCRILLCGNPDSGNPSSLGETELRAWHEAGIIEWLGHVDDIERVLSSADIACLPSYREGMPKFLLDAAASGLPLVATDVPGCRDVVTHGSSGLIVPEQDSLALADALEELLADPDLRKSMGEANRKRAELEFSENHFVERITTILADLDS